MKGDDLSPSRPIRSVWIATREYAGIAEAGGVKNVACSLAESLARKGVSVTVFIPRYGFVESAGMLLFSTDVAVAGETHRVCFYSLSARGVRIILVDAHVFAEKRAVYVYTETDEKVIPGAKRGKGHMDVDLVNMLFQRSVLAFALASETVPEVLHCQDAHTAILPALARNDSAYARLFERTATVVTVHNAGPGYRQAIPGLERAARMTGLPEIALARALFNGNVEPFLLAAEYGALTTVSPWYANELTDPAFDRFSEGISGELRRRRIEVTGITNGIDFHRYDPRDTALSLLPYPYDPIEGEFSGKYRCREEFARWLASDEAVPGIVKYGRLSACADSVYFSYHGRIAWQKGLDVLEKAARSTLDTLPGARFVVLGQGDPALEALFVMLSQRYEGRVAYISGYERNLARLAVAISDFIVLPSAFEPCGLEDFIAQIFGTIPVAHAVGGLRKIEDGISGFLYGSADDDNDSLELARLLVDLGKPVSELGVRAGEDRARYGAGCAAVEEYRRIISYAATRVRDISNWDAIAEASYIPLYRKIVDAMA